MTALLLVAVIFVHKFIYKTRYVDCKQTAYNSANDTDDKFYNFNHVLPSFHKYFLKGFFIR